MAEGVIIVVEAPVGFVGAVIQRLSGDADLAALPWTDDELLEVDRTVRALAGRLARMCADLGRRWLPTIVRW